MAGGEFYRSTTGEEDNSTLSGSGRPGHYFGGGASEEAGSYNPQGEPQNYKTFIWLYSFFQPFIKPVQILNKRGN